MSLRTGLTAGALTAGVVAAVLVGPAQAAVAAPDQELPFTCAETWTGSTRASHSPSSRAVDFNREADLNRPVLASGSGVVTRVEDLGGRSYGKWIRVDHGDGWTTLYAHLSQQLVVVGQRVDQGQMIGRVGSSGGSSGPHLHYEQRLGSTVQTAAFGGRRFVYGVATPSANCVDVPVAGDWDGNGSFEAGVYHRDARPVFEQLRPGATATRVRVGRGFDNPFTGDFDGDGRTDVGVRRPTARFVLRTAAGELSYRNFGLPRDLPVAGDWDGDGRDDLGVWRPGAAKFRLAYPDGTRRGVRLGDAGSLPVTGDWDADGRTDLGVYDQPSATFTLRAGGALQRVQLGSGRDLPVAGDWNGDGRGDVGVWSPATAQFTLRVSPAPDASPRYRTTTFGRTR